MEFVVCVLNLRRYLVVRETFLDPVVNPPKCANLKEKCGLLVTTEEECLLVGCCFLNNICWKDVTAIPGFVQVRKMTFFGSTIKATKSYTLKQCSDSFLSNKECNCFVYHHQYNYCITSKEPCKTTGSVTEVSSYEKIAKPDITCFSLSCNFTEEHSNSTFSECSNQCKQENDCKFFVHATGTLQKKCKTLEISNCDVEYKINRKDVSLKTCLNGAITKETLESKQLTVSPVSQGDCVTVTSENEYNLRIAWPSIDFNEKKLFLEVKGKNFTNCIHSAKNDLSFGLMAYTTISFQKEPMFLGRFYGCDIKQSNNTDYCKFLCDCEKNACDAVFIKNFALKDKNLEICSYKIITV